MNEKLYEICGEVLKDEEKAKKFAEMETVDELYDYFSEKIPELSKEDFEDFIIEILEENKKSQESPSTLDDDALENVAGGFNLGTKLASAGLAAMALFSGVSVGATSKGLNDVSSQSGSAIVQSVNKDKKSVVSEKFGKVKSWIKDNVNSVTGLSLGSATLNVAASRKNSNKESKQLEAKWFTAAQEGQLDVIKKSINQGINVDAVDSAGQTALMHAAFYHNDTIVKELIGQGADLNIKDNEGDTALMLAAYHNSYENVKELIKHGANLNTRNNQGETALMKAAWGGKKEIIAELIKSGANVKAKSDAGWTALMYAASFGNVEALKELTGSGADYNIRDDSGMTALMWATQVDSAETVKELVKLGINVNETDKNGRTALICAVDNSAEESVKELIKSGADVNIKDKDGKTALDLAIERDNTEIVKILNQISKKH